MRAMKLLVSKGASTMSQSEMSKWPSSAAARPADRPGTNAGSWLHIHLRISRRPLKDEGTIRIPWTGGMELPQSLEGLHIANSDGSEAHVLGGENARLVQAEPFQHRLLLLSSSQHSASVQVGRTGRLLLQQPEHCGLLAQTLIVKGLRMHPTQPWQNVGLSQLGGHHSAVIWNDGAWQLVSPEPLQGLQAPIACCCQACQGVP